MQQPDTNDTTLMLRLPSELKDKLQKAAFSNDRRITAEVNVRLRNSFNTSADATNLPVDAMARMGAAIQEDAPAPYSPRQAEIERAILALVRRMPEQKQAALLALLQ